MVIINPLTMFALFISYTDHMKKSDVLEIGRKTSIAVAVTLLICTWFGMKIFTLFGINLAALQLAGGISLLVGSLKGLSSNVEVKENLLTNISIVPLCIPVIAGPAAISVVINMTQVTKSPVAISLASLTVALVLGVMFHFVDPICHWLGETVMNIIKKISYLILACIGAQLLMAGYVFFIKI